MENAIEDVFDSSFGLNDIIVWKAKPFCRMVLVGRFFIFAYLSQAFTSSGMTILIVIAAGAKLLRHANTNRGGRADTRRTSHCAIFGD